MKRKTRVVNEPQLQRPTEIPDSRKGLESQEAIYSRGSSEGIAALRNIRDLKLFRHRQYGDFDTYMEQVWHRTRQWATQEINFLRVVELFEEMTGKAPYHGELKKEWAQHLKKLLNEPDELIRAYTEAKEEAVRTDQPVNGERVKEIVQRRLGFLEARQRWAKYADPPLQYKEYLVLAPLKEEYRASLPSSALEKAASGDLPLKDALLEACRQHKCIPPPDKLLKHFRCDALEEATLPLLGLQMEWEHAKVIQAQQEKVKADLAIFKSRPDGPRIVREATGDGPEQPSEDDFLRAVASILEHFWASAQHDYEDASQEAKARHVFREMTVAREFLSRDDGQQVSAAG